MDKKKIAADCYRRGTDALNAKNFPFAVEMYQTCAQLAPGNLMYRQILRGAERKMYGDNGTGAGGLSKLKISKAKSAAKAAVKKEDYEAADKALEEGLKLNPWDPQLNYELAQVARKQDHLEVAEFAMGIAVQADPNDDDMLEAFADTLCDLNKYDQASKIWSKISELRPNDGEARANISRMSVLNTQHRGGYEDADNTNDVRVKEAEFNKKLNKDQQTEQDEIGALERAIRKSPKETQNYSKLGDLLADRKEYQKAFDVLGEGLKIDPGNAGLVEEQQKIELTLLRKSVRDLQEGGDKDAIMQARKTLLRREIEIYSDWVKRRPQDMDVKYELAQRLMQIKKFQAAIPLLQKATQSPKHKAKAYVGLGRAFIQDKKLSLARGQFERAIPDLNSETDPDTFIDAHYLLGRVCEELGETEKAEDYYGEVLVHNYEYKDAKDRLERLQSSATKA